MAAGIKAPAKDATMLFKTNDLGLVVKFESTKLSVTV